MTVHCLFHDYSDYECSAETLIAVYLTADDAETGLLELIARAERLRKENQAFDQRYRDCHALNRSKQERAFKGKQLHTFRPNNKAESELAQRFTEEYNKEIQQISDEQTAWRLKEFGSDYADLPDDNIDSYHIDEVEIGVVRS